MMIFVNVKANRGRRKNAGAGGARANAGRKKAESAGDALAVINQPATPVAKKIKSKRMNFDSPDNQELMNEAIQGFRNKRGRFWQPGLSARSYADYVFQERSKSCQECRRGEGHA